MILLRYERIDKVRKGKEKAIKGISKVAKRIGKVRKGGLRIAEIVKGIVRRKIDKRDEVLLLPNTEVIRLSYR